MQLYSYFRSSASYRVRIALALKGLAYDYVPVHLVKNEQLAAAYRALSRRRSSCRLARRDGAPATLTQSLAIIEYLDETHPEPPLLPTDPLGRARVRALALDIACEIHPLDNLRVLRYLMREMKVWPRTTRTAGTGTGSRPASRRSSASSPAIRRPGASATATRPAWPTARWCRRSSTPGAWTAGSTTCRR